jgi:hypothetical protein
MLRKWKIAQLDRHARLPKFIVEVRPVEVRPVVVRRSWSARSWSARSWSAGRAPSGRSPPVDPRQSEVRRCGISGRGGIYPA